MKKQSITYKKLTLCLFLFALVLPNLVYISGIENTLTNNENRTTQKIPKFNFKQPIYSVGKFKNYYLENFGLKTTLVNNYINLKTDFLDENPIPNRTIKGKDNWCFLGNNYNNVLNNSFGNDPFTKKELENTLDYLTTISHYFKSQNITFYLVIPPDKNRIYQEFLPYKLNQKKTKLDVLKEHLISVDNIILVDLYKTLLSNKKDKQLYFKTDTHWNFDGAFIGYSQTMDVINNTYNIDKLTSNDFTVKTDVFAKGDLTKMINKSETEGYNKYNLNYESEVEIIYNNKKEMRFKNKSKNLKLMQFRDSFANSWYSFFNESFADVMYLKKYTFTKNEIEAFKPDIVIFEIVERNIDLFGNLTPFKN